MTLVQEVTILKINMQTHLKSKHKEQTQLKSQAQGEISLASLEIQIQDHNITLNLELPRTHVSKQRHGKQISVHSVQPRKSSQLHKPQSICQVQVITTVSHLFLQNIKTKE